MKSLLAFAFLTFAVTPTFSQDAPAPDPSKPPCMAVDDAKKALTANGEKFVEISIQSILGVDERPATGLLVSTLQGTVVVGIEVGDGVGNDCIFSLHPIGTIKAAVGG
jgi:hypothetical protein